MQKGVLIKLIAILIATLIGIGYYFADPATILILLLVSFMLAFAAIILLLFGFLDKEFKSWHLIGFIPIVVGFGLTSIIRDYKRNKAVAITTEIEQFKKEKGQYPKSLDELKTKIEIDGLSYGVDSGGKEYSIQYYMDRFNRRYYDSKTKTWGTLGWND